MIEYTIRKNTCHCAYLPSDEGLDTGTPFSAEADDMRKGGSKSPTSYLPTIQHPLLLLVVVAARTSEISLAPTVSCWI